LKGTIFVGFAEFIELNYGLATWFHAIEQCSLKSDGIYLATEIYHDNEFELIIEQLTISITCTREKLLREFGQHFFPKLMSMAEKQASITNLFEFLFAIEKVIHIELKKAGMLITPPTLFYDQPKNNILIIRYVSERKMCYFAEGLIIAAANFFNQTVSISQSQCLCKGDDHCLIRIET